MTYNKAMDLAKQKSMIDDKNYIVYYDSEEGQEGYWVRQEDDYWLMHEGDQKDIAMWWNGGVWHNDISKMDG